MDKKLSIAEVIKQYLQQCKNQNVNIFHGRDLIGYVRAYLQHFGRHPYDGTIFRTLRRLRQKGLVNYMVVDKYYYKIEQINF